ncbi:MAG: hypothetical protein HQL90_04560 [Magnetococcales bacterium]|nr:hypothetical protein [Magnetococcales bacterium]
MNISNIADFLVSQVVKTAAGLQQQNKDNSNQGVIKPQRDKLPQRSVESNRVHTPSSAYRVTISSAAMQKMAASV